MMPIRSTASTRRRPLHSRISWRRPRRRAPAAHTAAPAALINALGSVLTDTALDPAFIAQALTVPSESDIAREIGADVDPDAVFTARTALRRALGRALAPELASAYERFATPGPYSPDAAAAGRRALKNGCLDLLAVSREADGIARTVALYRAADNMTDPAPPPPPPPAPPPPPPPSWPTARRRSATPRSPISMRASGTIRWWSTNGSRCRRRSRTARHARPGARAHHAPFLLHGQSEPGAGADRLLRGG
jgi:hypothetical protein